MPNSSRLDDQRRRLYALKRAPALRHTSNTVLLQLLDEAEEVRWAQDAVLCREDQESEGFFLLLDGELEVRRGEELLLTLRPCTPLGVEALVGGRSAVTARAVVPSRGLFFPRERVWDVVHARAGLRQDLGQLKQGAPAREALHAQAEVITFESDLRDAPLSALIELVAKVIAHDFGDRVLLLRAGPDALVTEGLDGVLRATFSEPAPGTPCRVDVEVLHRLTLEHHVDYVFLDGCSISGAVTPGKTVRLVASPAHARPPLGSGGRLLPTVVIDPERPSRGAPLGGQPQQDGTAADTRVLPACWLRLGLERLVGRPVDARPLDALELSDAELDALSRWARAITQRRVGLALGGGGVWGFYHVHILRWLVGQGIPIDLISGASMGSLVGAYFCGTALDGKSGLEGLLRLEERAVNRQLSLATTGAIFTTYSLERFVAQDLGHTSLEELPIRFLPVTTDLTSGDCVALEQGPLALGVRASGSAPGLFAPTVLPPARYVDGAFTSMVPANVLLNAGADIIFSSNIFPFGVRDTPRMSKTRLGRFLAGLNPVTRALDLVASGVLLLHRSGDSEALLADVSYDIQSAELPLLTAMDFTRARDILERAASDEALAAKLEELKAHWQQVKTRATAGAARAGRQAA
ncbi:cyclic nucleotide-binding and patatin-like phospholipase domain-containing protein [Pyxidicoccus xibeiensis]|uniref:cyclic nucleotide-binding and patatin-like phospholipase domain-containing protein n=1 Tax=Pyxidicoccus xibeiensis TaxID=2906759 RepID=UPI0020A730BD|nr:cyclic nucleotide-binding and patatin-like phospholipase domain-containing protein [Pyxidicoccus xibeiensis]MCP3143017.1 patatin-like phospholipase domain-containing protein [Pyxidicoccus xibeiensis]